MFVSNLIIVKNVWTTDAAPLSVHSGIQNTLGIAQYIHAWQYRHI